VYAAIDETTLVKALHDLALSIAMAKKAGNKGAVAGLYAQFQEIAEQYRSIGSGEASILNLINNVGDGVTQFLNTAGTVAEKGISLVSAKLLVPLAVIAGVVYLAPLLGRKHASA
jgi:hypothetical protein